jgi:hypothetical protein
MNSNMPEELDTGLGARVITEVIKVSNAFAQIANEAFYEVIEDNGLMDEAMADGDNLQETLVDAIHGTLKHALEDAWHLVVIDMNRFTAVLWLLVSARAKEVGQQAARDWMASREKKA